MNREDAKAEWKRATVGLGAANTLAISGYNNDAVSRAYYAILHAAKAGLATKGIDAGSHRGVAAMFGKEFVKTGQMEAQDGKNLRRADAARQNADYQARMEFTEDQTHRECERAHDFLTKMREQLKRAGLGEDELAITPKLGGTKSPTDVIDQPKSMPKMSPGGADAPPGATPPSRATGYSDSIQRDRGDPAHKR